MMKRVKILIAVFTVVLLNLGNAKGQIWKPLGQGFQQIPVAVTNTSEFVYFAFVDSVTSSNKNKIIGVARWNGFFWQNLSTFIAGSDSYVTSLEWYQDKLYAGGFFDTVYFNSSKTGLMVLDGKKWANAAKRRVDDQSPVRINDLKTFNGYLYAAGNFTRIDTTRAVGMAKYDGTKWDGVEQFQGANTIGFAHNLEVYDDTLFVSGNYKLLSQNKYIPIFKVKGNVTIADSSSPFSVISLLQGGKGELMAFGVNDNQEKIIYSYTGGTWKDRSKGFPNLKLANFADAEFFDDEFWACGTFDIGSSKTNSIIKWADTSWVVLNDLNLTATRFIRAFRGRMFVSGGFTNFGRIQLNHVAEYDPNLAIIVGRVYHDANNNCKRDNNEKPLPAQVVRLFNGIAVAYTDREGVYYFVVPKSGTYPITIQPRKYWTLSNCNTAQYVFSPTSSNSIFDSADFALRLDASIEDVSVKILPNAGNKMRRGFTELYSINYQNNGGKTVPNGIIRLKIADSLKDFSAFPPPASVTNKVAEWNFTNLEPGDEKTILFKGKVNSSTTNEIVLLAEAVGNNDVYGEDNYDTLQQTVEDTNSLSGKYIFPEPEKNDTVTVFDVGGGKYEVQYLIRFENTTTDTVNTVVVVDTIDLNLSIEYIQEMGASHPYTTQVINLPPQLGKGILVWTFSNINLPPNLSKSNDFTDNRGHIRFKLQLNDKTPIGTIVKNKADVLFDFSNQYTTNNVYCMLDRLTGIAPVLQTINGVTVYPNPATSQLVVSLADEAEYTLTVSDVQGRTCLPSQTFNGKSTALNVAALPQGVYFARITSGSQTACIKFVKQ